MRDAITVKGATKWGLYSIYKKVWMRRAQGGEYHVWSSEEPALRQRSTNIVGGTFVFVLLQNNDKRNMTRDPSVHLTVNEFHPLQDRTYITI